MIGIIKIGIIILVALILIIECFLGIRRGTKKMMIRMLSIVVLMFISLGIISLITEPFLGKLITKFFESAGSSGSYKEMVEAVLGNAGLSNDGSEILSGFTVGMTIALCKPVVFVFVLMVLRLLTWPVYIVVMKKIDKKSGKSTEEDGPSWLLGTIVGLVCGIFCSAIILMPLAKFNEYQLLANENEYLENYIGEERYQNFSFYDSSLVHYVFVTVGLESLSGKIYDVIATVTIDEKQYKAGEIMPEFLAMIPDACEFVLDNNKMNRDKEYSARFNAANKFYDKFLNVSFFTEDEKATLVRMLLSKLKVQETEYDEIAGTAQQALLELSDEDLLPEVTKLLTLLNYFAEEGLINSDKEGPLSNSGTVSVNGNSDLQAGNKTTFDLTMVSDMFAENTADLIYNMKIAESIVPEFVNWILQRSFTVFDIDAEAAPAGSDFASTKDDFSELINTAINILNIFSDTTEVSELTSEAQNKLVDDMRIIQNSPLVSQKTSADIKQWMDKNLVEQ